MDMSAMLPLFMSMMGGGKNGIDTMSLMNAMMNQNKNSGAQNTGGKGIDMGAMMNMMSAMMGGKNSSETKKEESPYAKYADNPNFQNENYCKEEPSPSTESPVPPHIMQMLNLMMNMKKAT